MGILGAVLLVCVIFIRPQEFVPGLASIGILNLLTAFAVIGIVVEFGMGKTKSAWSPQLPFLLAFVLWCYLVTAIKAGRSELAHTSNTVLFSTIFLLIVMYGARTFERFATMCAVLLCVGIFLSGIGIAQSQTDFECIIVSAEDIAAGDRATGTRTGRGCVLSAHECDEEALKSGSRALENGDEYSCERPGPFDTFSVSHGRVRWRGVLADPNELSLAIGAALAFAFALHSHLKTRWRHILVAITLASASYTIVQTQSRGGVLVLLALGLERQPERVVPKPGRVRTSVARQLERLGPKQATERGETTLVRDGIGLPELEKHLGYCGLLPLHPHPLRELRGDRGHRDSVGSRERGDLALADGRHLAQPGSTRRRGFSLADQVPRPCCLRGRRAREFEPGGGQEQQ